MGNDKKVYKFQIYKSKPNSKLNHNIHYFLMYIDIYDYPSSALVSRLTFIYSCDAFSPDIFIHTFNFCWEYFGTVYIF